MEKYYKLSWLLAILLPAAGATLGCNGFKACQPNPNHTAQTGCTCGCTNNSNAAECLDPNNACCYEPNGACKTTTTTTPMPSSSTAPAMSPANTDGVRATMVRCFEEKGLCTNAYPLLACQQFYERVQYVNVSNAMVDGSQTENTPVLVIPPPLELPYAFSFAPKQVPWTALAPGGTLEVPNEIRATNSAGMDGPGLDPGAQQCQKSASFTIQLARARPLEDAAGQVFEQVMIDETSDQPFGQCQKGSGC